jgi:hypothetical protein
LKDPVTAVGIITSPFANQTLKETRRGNLSIPGNDVFGPRDIATVCVGPIGASSGVPQLRNTQEMLNAFDKATRKPALKCRRVTAESLRTIYEQKGQICLAPYLSKSISAWRVTSFPCIAAK